MKTVAKSKEADGKSQTASAELSKSFSVKTSQEGSIQSSTNLSKVNASSVYSKSATSQQISALSGASASKMSVAFTKQKATSTVSETLSKTFDAVKQIPKPQ